MEDTRITFETAKLAKKKGFLKEWADLAYKKDDQKLYGDTGIYTDYPAPTQSLLSKWLREKHNIHLIAYKNINIDGYDWCYITTDGITNINSYKTYEEAFEIGLQEALKLIK